MHLCKLSRGLQPLKFIHSNLAHCACTFPWRIIRTPLVCHSSLPSSRSKNLWVSCWFFWSCGSASAIVITDGGLQSEDCVAGNGRLNLKHGELFSSSEGFEFRLIIHVRCTGGRQSHFCHLLRSLPFLMFPYLPSFQVRVLFAGTDGGNACPDKGVSRRPALLSQTHPPITTLILFWDAAQDVYTSFYLSGYSITLLSWSRKKGNFYFFHYLYLGMPVVGWGQMVASG